MLKKESQCNIESISVKRLDEEISKTKKTEEDEIEENCKNHTNVTTSSKKRFSNKNNTKIQERI